jgi:hypothetical protein
VPVSPADQLVHAFKLSQLHPFKFTHQDGKYSDPNWPSLPVAGLHLHCWKRDSAAEFRAEVTDGRSWIGVTNLNSDLSAQMLFQFDEKPLVPGKSYRVRIEYMTTNEGEGVVSVRNPKGSEYPSVVEARLDRTEGKWKTLEMTFQRPRDGKIDICVVNTAVGEGNLLAVRLMEVFETAEK